MKKIPVIFLFLFPAVFVVAQKKDAKLIVTAFENYKNAILNDNAEDAIKYVDSRTIAYYGKALELVKTADSAKVNSLNILDKFIVLAIRHRTEKEKILSFDARGLFMYAVKSGMVGKNTVTDQSLGEIEVDGNFAKAKLVMNGEAAPFYFHFYKEEGQWKMDLTSLFPVSIEAFDHLVKGSGKSENQFIFSLLEMLTGEKPGPDIWQPLI